MTKVAGNQFSPVPPERDALGRTAQEFMAEMFEFSYCEECGQDADQHTAVIGPFGAWFAYCDKPPAE